MSYDAFDPVAVSALVDGDHIAITYYHDIGRSPFKEVVAMSLIGDLIDFATEAQIPCFVENCGGENEPKSE